MEKGVYNFALKEADIRKIVKKWDNPKFVHIYLNRLRSIIVNLQNPKLIEQVKSGEIKPHTVAFMTHQEMQPERWKELLIQKSIKDKNKFEKNIEAATDTFTCRKCKKNKCTYYQMQIRSSDEPMTTFITCLECDHKWKQN
jgi:transcription elongation factor S-II